MKKHFLRYKSERIRFLFLPLILLLLFTKGFAQQEYHTNSGLLNIKMHLNDQMVQLNSGKLLIILDYESGNIVMKQKVVDLSPDNDSLRSLMTGMKVEMIEFEGKLGLDYINTSGHPPLDFQVEGVILPFDYKVLGNGHLEHFIENTATSCILSMEFIVELDQVDPDFGVEGLDHKIYIQIVQSLLARGNEK